MNKYYITIDGERVETKTKQSADAILIDAFLSGKQNIDFNIYTIEKKQKPNKSGYCVLRQTRKWTFVPELNIYCWTEIENKKITPYRNLIDKANDDFDKLGLSNAKKGTIYCHDDIKAGELWVRYIVQYKRV